MQQHFPGCLPEVRRLLANAGKALPRPLPDELHADRHHRAATLFEAATRLGAPHEGRGWRYWLDELFLSPRWGFIGSLAVFAAVLFVVFYVSGWIDSETSARLVDVGGAVAAGVHRRRRRARRGGRPDRTRRHRGAVHDPAGAAAGGAGGGRHHGAHRLRGRPDVSPHRTARRRRGAVPARAGLQRAGDLRHRQHDDGPRARDGLAAGDLRALLGALGDHSCAGRQVSGRAGRVRDLPAHHGGDRRARTGAAAPLPARRPGPGAGDSALRAAALAAHAARDLGAHPRHPHHRHAAAGRRQRGAGAARARRRRPLHQRAALPDHLRGGWGCPWCSACPSCSACCARSCRC